MKAAIYNQNLLLTSREFEKEREFWLSELKNVKEMSGFPPIETPEFQWAENPAPIYYYFPDKLVTRLQEISKSDPFGLFLILLSGVCFLLHRYTGTTDLVVGIPALGSKQPIENSFHHILPIRIPCDEQTNYREFLLGLKETVAAAYEYQNFPWEGIVSLFGWNGKSNEQSCLKTLILFENIHDPLRIGELKPDTVFTFSQKGGELNCRLEYESKWHSREMMARIPEQTGYFLAQVLADPRIELTEAEILTAAEKQSLLYDCNQTRAEYPADLTVIDLFEAQVAAAPENVAVVCKDTRLTYRELNGLANRLAEQLRPKGVQADRIIGLMLENSPELVIGLLGILKAGGAYLPLDPAYPRERLRYMIEDSGVRLILTRPELVSPEIYSGETLGIELAELQALPQTAPNPTKINHPEDLAYIIYTSGSTGRPKGALITHQGLTNYLWWAKKVYVQGKGANFPLYSSLSFDLTVTALYTPLITGGKLIIQSTDAQPLLIREIMADEETEAVKLTPAHLGIASGFCQQSKVRTLIVGGEDLKTELAARIYREFNGQIAIYNEYGPTETVVGCMIHLYDPENDRRGSVPIGIPADNVQIYLLDEKLRPAPAGVAGEIYIGGDGVARGYLNQPELTAQRFLANPFQPGSRMYRTGDLGRRLPDGKLEFLGRVDHQVKIRGYRIEPSEIESRLFKHPAVKEAAVLDKTDRDGSKYLCAYIVGNQELTPAQVADIRDSLTTELPDYMIPTYFIKLERLPLTTNGKVDRGALVDRRVLVDGRALPEPDEQRQSGSQYVAPRNETEARLAGIWQEVLGVEAVGIHDNFFELGGQSLKAIGIVELAEQQNLHLSVKEIFKHRTIDALLDNIDCARMVDSDGQTAATKDSDSNEPTARKELKIVLQREVTSFLGYSLPLCIIEGHAEMLTWYYQHFIQISAQIGRTGYVMLDYEELFLGYWDIVRSIKIPYFRLDDGASVLEFVKEKIAQEYYVFVFIDEYHLPAKSHYQNDHFVHESLVYGFDDGRQTLLAVGFGKEAVLCKFEINYAHFIEAFESGRTHYRDTAPYAKYQAVELLKLKEIEGEHPFDRELFLQEFQDYLQSRSEKNIYSGLMPPDESYSSFGKLPVVYGLEIYDLVVAKLEELLQGNILIDYRSIHLFAEHKEGLCRRLKYFVSRYHPAGEAGALLGGYEAVVKEVQSVRIKFMELVMTGADSITGLEPLIKRLIEVLRELKLREKAILQELIALFSNNMEEDSDE